MVDKGAGDRFDQLLHSATSPTRAFERRAVRFLGIEIIYRKTLPAGVRTRGNQRTSDPDRRRGLQAGTPRLRDLLLADKTAHGIAGLRADPKPVLDALGVEREQSGLLQRIVRP